MEALAPRFDQLARASRAMKVHPLDRAITRLEPKLRVAGESARRAGVGQCLQHDVPRTIVNVLRAPVASEQLALIFKRTNPRLDAAEEAAKSATTHVQGLRDYAATLADREAAVRAMHVPRCASRERGEYLGALHACRVGIAEVADRHAAGVDTPDAELATLIKHPEKRMNRMIEKPWGGLGARPTTRF